MMSTIRKSLEILEPRERRLFYFLVLFSIMLGPVEVLGIASVMPFLAMVADQDLVTSNEYLGEVYSFFGFQDSRSFIIALGLIVVGLLIVRTILFGFSVYANTRFAAMRSASIGHRLLRTYLTQNYTWFLNRHSADLAKTVLDEAKMVVVGILSPLIMLVTQLSASIFVIGFVIVIEPIAALVVFAAFVLAYGSVYAIARRYLGDLGDERVIANQARFQVAHEALAGIKDVKVSQLEDVYARRFFAPAVRLAQIDVLRAIIAYAPNGATQIGAVSSIVAAVIYLVVFAEETLADVLPVLGAFALAGYRLRPAVKDIYRTAVGLRFNRPALDLVHRELNLGTNQREPSQRHSAPQLGLERELELKSVGFTYPNAERPSVRDVSVAIPARATIGFVGSTGAGKTTVVDMILGLLPVQQGTLLADGVPITQDNVQEWQRCIGYVSQHIFLADDTVAGNIAFGVPQHSIDMEAVERAARIAQLHDFVADSLPMGYQTEIGERGVRLSGGQRQRIGIARALYHDPDVLILDEATSALDNLTERAVIDAVHNLRNRKTIIMIAHRLTTVKDCSRIFLLEHGKLMDEGSYSELLERNREFQSLVAAGG